MPILKKLALSFAISSALLLQTCASQQRKNEYIPQYYNEIDHKNIWKDIQTGIEAERLKINAYPNPKNEDNSIIRDREYYEKATSK